MILLFDMAIFRNKFSMLEAPTKYNINDENFWSTVYINCVLITYLVLKSFTLKCVWDVYYALSSRSAGDKLEVHSHLLLGCNYFQLWLKEDSGTAGLWEAETEVITCMIRGVVDTELVYLYFRCGGCVMHDGIHIYRHWHLVVSVCNRYACKTTYGIVAGVQEHQSGRSERFKLISNWNSDWELLVWPGRDLYVAQVLITPCEETDAFQTSDVLDTRVFALVLTSPSNPVLLLSSLQIVTYTH